MRPNRGFRRGFRRKTPMQWVCSTSGYAPPTGGAGSALTNNTIIAVELVGSTPAATFDPPAIDRYTVRRVLGQVLFQDLAAAPNAGYNVSLGIIVQSVVAGGSATSYNPGISSDAGAPWLWLRHLILGTQGGAAIQGAGIVPTWGFSAVDIKSKRTLREGERLMLFAVATRIGGTGTDTLTMFPCLRSLIARVA